MNGIVAGLLLSPALWAMGIGYFVSDTLLIAGFLYLLLALVVLAWIYPRREQADVPDFMREGRPTL